jgi:hypothetical protein
VGENAGIRKLKQVSLTDLSTKLYKCRKMTAHGGTTLTLNIWFSWTYVENIELGRILQDTQLVGTVMQEALKVPEGHISWLHCQAGDKERRICGQYHQ